MSLPWIAAAGGGKPARFVDDSFADFAAGTLDAGGHNIYACCDGTVRTINRFDLNRDGHLDVLFNCTHDTYQMLPATAGVVLPGRETRTDDVPVEGSQRVALGDLNGDGYTDAVFCPNPIGVHHDRRHVWVAWGGPDGWPRRRVNGVLPINGAANVALPDLDADGRPDVAVLGAERWRPEQPPGRIVRVYRNSATGFSVVEFDDLGVPGATDIAAGDFDGDGAADLAVLRGDGKVSVFWAGKAKSPPAEAALPGPASALFAADADGDGRPDLVAPTGGPQVYVLKPRPGRAWAAAKAPGVPATHAACGDFDGDGKPELVLVQFDQARAAGGEQAGAGKEALGVVNVLWGADGWDPGHATKLPVPAAAATAAGDLDGDGKTDLVVAVHQGGGTFNGESFAFFGTGGRGFVPGKRGFRTSGTTDVAVAPAEKGLPARAVFCNTIGGRFDEGVPLQLYWGGPKGLDPKRLLKIPFHSGYEASAADLNADGFPDLIALDSGHAGAAAHDHAGLGANIFWGTKDGLDTAKPTVLREEFLGTSSVADLDKDGYLDLVLEPFGPAAGKPEDELFVYYGGPKGFDRSRRRAFPKPGYGQEHLVADLNADGWLDLALTTRKDECVRIWWGGPKGFDPAREQRLKVSAPLGVDAADFNADGHIDLLVGSYNDPVSGYRDMGSLIFWGSADGFRHHDAQWLPGYSPLGRTVADLDGDGWLDIFSPQHSGELTREDLACHIYWGGPRGFSRQDRTTIFADSVNDSVAADFDGDGRLDLAVACHTRHGNHRARSRVFYNDGGRFASPRVQYLDTNGPHLMWAADVGHILDRKYRQTFTSRPFAFDRPAAGGTVTARADVPAGAKLELLVRSAATPEQLDRAAWQPAGGGRFALASGDRVVQYRAVFLSDNGDRFPVLDRVEMALGD